MRESLMNPLVDKYVRSKAEFSRAQKERLARKYLELASLAYFIGSSTRVGGEPANPDQCPPRQVLRSAWFDITDAGLLPDRLDIKLEVQLESFFVPVAEHGGRHQPGGELSLRGRATDAQGIKTPSVYLAHMKTMDVVVFGAAEGLFSADNKPINYNSNEFEELVVIHRHIDQALKHAME